ncbi:hypothetical protein [Bremerella cremea]|uniref:hypothetical protein n=1 Tax=Bremerella cremea TaxID=1031537 RepID=UPI0031F09D57
MNQKRLVSDRPRIPLITANHMASNVIFSLNSGAHLSESKTPQRVAQIDQRLIIIKRVDKKVPKFWRVISAGREAYCA